MGTAETRRTGARRKGEVTVEVLAELAAGRTESVNLMEWLAADMGALARAIAAQDSDRSRSIAIVEAGNALAGLGILARLSHMGKAIRAAAPDHATPWREGLARHGSDLVRQWACYAANEATGIGLPDRLALTLPFAADHNMSVREAAWMAFRPHIHLDVRAAVAALEPHSRSADENVRRFCVEVTRPRSVWGTHIKALKENPGLGLPILENVRRDRSRYVRLALGNWLNDASKSRPAWVSNLCDRWAGEDDPPAASVIRRARRTLGKTGASGWTLSCDATPSGVARGMGGGDA